MQASVTVLFRDWQRPRPTLISSAHDRSGLTVQLDVPRREDQVTRARLLEATRSLDSCSHAIPAMQEEAEVLIAGLVFAAK